MSSSFSKDYVLAIFTALFVTILWSSSWVIIKFGLKEISPLIFAAFRYSIASLILLVLIFTNKSYRQSLYQKSKNWYVMMLIYGLIFITFTQGGQFLALSVLPAITVSFILNITPYIVIFYSIPFLKEIPSHKDLILFSFAFIGVIFYFIPTGSIILSVNGLLIGIFLLNTNALSSILGRIINRESSSSPLLITGISMSFGTFFLLIIAIIWEGIPIFSPLVILMILWLAIINTALAFTLWNKAMQKLRAMDITIINGTMLPQIVLLSIIFLNELPQIHEWIGLMILIFATFMIQFIQAKKNSNKLEFKN